jgi:hypothetical protein
MDGMNFNDNLPKQLAQLSIRRQQLQLKMTEMYHDCDCEYCDRDEFNGGYTEADVKKINQELADIEKTFTRARRYAKLHGIDVSAEVIISLKKQILAEERRTSTTNLK